MCFQIKDISSALWNRLRNKNRSKSLFKYKCKGFLLESAQ